MHTQKSPLQQLPSSGAVPVLPYEAGEPTSQILISSFLQEDDLNDAHFDDADLADAHLEVPILALPTWNAPISVRHIGRGLRFARRFLIAEPNLSLLFLARNVMVSLSLLIFVGVI